MPNSSVTAKSPLANLGDVRGPVLILKTSEDQMNEISKTVLNKKIWHAIDKKEPINGNYLLKNSDTIVHVDISFTIRETFVDENGVKWVRA